MYSSGVHILAVNLANAYRRICNTECNPSPRQCPMGIAKSLDLRLMGKIVGGRVKADDQTVCYSAVWTKYEREQLIGVAI